MKLIIQIPCYNEEQTLPQTLQDLPREIPGIDLIEVLIIDDGSRDRTIAVAREHGVHHVVKFPRNRGLAQAFKAGLDASVRLGADVIVNTDGDNQYRGEDVRPLVTPILDGDADIVIGDRQTDTIAHFGFVKKRLQKLGSAVVRRVSRTEVDDTTSGFRAYSREAALRLNLVSEYTYTLETIIQAGQGKMAVDSVKIRTNPTTRPSRLFTGIPQYIRRQAGTILRIFMMYRPLYTFLWLGGLIFTGALGIVARFVYFWIATGSGAGHVQSLILAGALLGVAAQVVMMGLLADLIAANRKLIEDVLVRVKRVEASAPRPSEDE